MKWSTMCGDLCIFQKHLVPRSFFILPHMGIVIAMHERRTRSGMKTSQWDGTPHPARFWTIQKQGKARQCSAMRRGCKAMRKMLPGKKLTLLWRVLFQRPVGNLYVVCTNSTCTKRTYYLLRWDDDGMIEPLPSASSASSKMASWLVGNWCVCIKNDSII